MRALFVSRVLAMMRGGGETYMLNIAAALQHEGVEVDFLVCRPVLGRIRHPMAGFDTTYVRTPYLRPWAERVRGAARPSAWGRLSNALATALYTLDDHLSQFLLFLHVRRHGLQRRYDVIQTLSLPLLSALAVRRLNAVSVVRFPGPPSRRYARLIRACSAVVANGDALRAIRRDITAAAIDIPPGVDYERFHPGPSDFRVRCGIAPQERLILAVGRLVPIKQFSLLLQAFARVAAAEPDARLLIAGEGPLEPDLRHLARDLHIDTRVVFAGHVDNAALPAIYAAADLFTITSSYDNFPNAVLEAMASALPVVGTRVGGIPTQVSDGETGLLVESGNVDQLADSILSLLRAPQWAQRLGARGREIACTHFDWQVSARAFRSLYESLGAR